MSYRASRRRKPRREPERVQPGRRQLLPILRYAIGLGSVLGLGFVLSTLPTARGTENGPSVAEPTWVRHPDRPFSVSATEVTVAQFRACVEADACEVATTNEACNYGKAEHDSHPVNCVTYHGAEQYCTYAGGRVCTEEEWLAACRGSQGRAFPYGDAFDLTACNVQSQTLTVEGRERGTAPAGSLAQCEGGLPGLFDMAGNVAEWVDSCKDSYCKFRGAGYLSNDPVDSFAACTGICSGNDRAFKSGVVGVRCCKDEIQ